MNGAPKNDPLADVLVGIGQILKSIFVRIGYGARRLKRRGYLIGFCMAVVVSATAFFIWPGGQQLPGPVYVTYIALVGWIGRHFAG